MTCRGERVISWSSKAVAALRAVRLCTGTISSTFSHFSGMQRGLQHTVTVHHCQCAAVQGLQMGCRRMLLIWAGA